MNVFDVAKHGAKGIVNLIGLAALFFAGSSQGADVFSEHTYDTEDGKKLIAHGESFKYDYNLALIKRADGAVFMMLDTPKSELDRGRHWHCLVDEPGKLTVLNAGVLNASRPKPSTTWLGEHPLFKGICPLPDGFYRVAGKATVFYFYSDTGWNGFKFLGIKLGNAHCAFKNPQDWKNYIAAVGHNASKPQSFTNIAPAGTNVWTGRINQRGYCPPNLPGIR